MLFQKSGRNRKKQTYYRKPPNGSATNLKTPCEPQLHCQSREDGVGAAFYLQPTRLLANFVSEVIPELLQIKGIKKKPNKQRNPETAEEKPEAQSPCGF